MSYILEALKKAQAERQLGNAPTIHAPAIIPAQQAAGGRKPLVIGFAAGAVLVAGALFAWRQQPPASGQVADAGKGATKVAVASQPLAQQTPAATPPAAASQPGMATEPAARPATPDTTARVALVEEPAGAARTIAPRAARAEHASGLKAAPSDAAPAPSPARAPASSQPLHAPAAPTVASHDVLPAQPASTGAQAALVARQATAAPAPSADDTLRTVNELPEQIRFSVPKVAFGGYMYSPNPADRLVLVDKALRHEGEEVAPGLVLERLLPKAAVMNYRGYRYRVPL